MRRFLPYFQTFVVSCAGITVIFAAAISVKSASEARTAAMRAVVSEKVVEADLKTLTINITITGGNAASRAAAEQIVRRVSDLNTTTPSYVSSYASR